MTMFVMFAGAIALMLLGVATANALGFTAVATFLAAGQFDNLFALVQRMYYSVSGTTLLAIPFFMIMGSLMTRSGISEKLFDVGRAFVGHRTGGLAMAAIIACMLMAAMSGSTVACAAGIGMIAIAEMEKSGYDKSFAAATIASGGTIGPIIPPSIMMVVYGSMTNVPVASMFAAGVIPGIMMGVLFMAVAYVISKKRKFQKTEKYTWKQRGAVLKDAFAALLAPVIIIGGMFGGFFTPTEAAAVSCLYVTLVGLFVYKTLKLKDILPAIWEAVEGAAKIMFILAVSGMFQYVLLYFKIPQAVLKAVMTSFSGTAEILLFMILVWLILGCFLDGTAILMITVPIFIPILDQIGFSLVQYGVIACVASAAGNLTPPLGVNLYTVSTISKVPMLSIAKEALPYILMIAILCVLMVFVQPLTLWLPSIIA